MGSFFFLITNSDSYLKLWLKDFNFFNRPTGKVIKKAEVEFNKDGSWILSSLLYNNNKAMAFIIITRIP
jgi:hypothetical protein